MRRRGGLGLGLEGTFWVARDVWCVKLRSLESKWVLLEIDWRFSVWLVPIDFHGLVVGAWFGAGIKKLQVAYLRDRDLIGCGFPDFNPLHGCTSIQYIQVRLREERTIKSQYLVHQINFSVPFTPRLGHSRGQNHLQ